MISFGLFLLAVALIIPPIIPDGTDFLLNIPLANWLVLKFSNAPISISFALALIMTYTLIPLVIIYASAFVHPSDTDGMFHRMIKKIKDKLDAGWQFIKRNPIIGIAGAVIFYYIATKYLSNLFVR